MREKDFDRQTDTCATGVVTGLVIRLVPGVFEKLEDDIVYSDEPAFHTPDDFLKSDYHQEVDEGTNSAL